MRDRPGAVPVRSNKKVLCGTHFSGHRSHPLDWSVGGPKARSMGVFESLLLLFDADKDRRRKALLLFINFCIVLICINLSWTHFRSLVSSYKHSPA